VEARIISKYATVAPVLNEQARRLWAATHVAEQPSAKREGKTQKQELKDRPPLSIKRFEPSAAKELRGKPSEPLMVVAVLCFPVL
jgi:hypothetical protein